MTPTIKHLTDSLIGVVGLPENTFGIERSNNWSGSRFEYKYGTMDYNNNYGHFVLPQGNYTIIGWSDELTKFQKAEIFKDTDFVWYPEESFASLLRSHGIEGRVLLLKKID